MKIRTQTCGIVDVEPKDVFEIWGGGFGAEGEFTHTLRCRDITEKYAHHVYSISTKAALRLSELSGKAIGRLQFNEIDDSKDAETPRTENVLEQQKPAEKKENTLLNYAQSIKHTKRFLN